MVRIRIALATLLATAGCGPTTPAPREVKGMPAAPSDLVLEQRGTSIELRWKDNSENEQGFRVDRGASEAGPWALVANLPAGSTSVVDTAPGSAPYYVVRAYNGIGYSTPSNVASTGSASTPPTTNPPAQNPPAQNPPTNNPPANTAPTVTLTAPANGASADAPATFTLSADASDDSGVTKVEFYEGARLLESDPSAPYSYIWTGVAAGSYSITAKAYDAAGLSTQSAAVTVTVRAPAVTFSVATATLINADNDQPVAGFDPIQNNATISFAAVGTTNLTIRANGQGTVGSVRFTLDGTVIRTESAVPYSLSGDNGAGDYPPFAFAAGAHTLVMTPFSMAAGAGTEGGALTLNFMIQQ